MALRFNPPPNWPAPPEGFVPPAGWQPDPAWGPAPEGWQLWVDDAAASPSPAVSSAPVVSSASDPAWAPTQAVSTGATPVADPTGQQVSAPSADYSASSGFSAPAVASAPDQTPYQAPTMPVGPHNQPGFQAPVPGTSAPMAGSAPTSSPYAASMDYAQSPTPYQPGAAQPGAAQPGFGAQPQAGGWQPLDVHGTQASTSTPITKQWWFWTIIAVVVLALVGGLIAVLVGGRDNDSSPTAGSTTQAPSAATDPTGSTSGGSGGCQEASSQNCPGSLDQKLTLFASEYSDDPNSTVDLTFGAVKWDATDDIRAAWEYGFEEPSDGYVYMRLPVTVTYHGEGQLSLYSLTFKYVRDGNSFESEYVYSSDELRLQTAPYDGGSVEGYVFFLIPSEYANSGAFAISYNYKDEFWMAEK